MCVLGQECIEGVVKIGFGGRREDGREMALGPFSKRRKYKGHNWINVGAEGVVGLWGVFGSEGKCNISTSFYTKPRNHGCDARIAALPS